MDEIPLLALGMGRDSSGLHQIHEQRATGAPPPGPLRQYGLFLRHYPHWYLIPIALVLGALAWLILAAGPPDTSFQYDLF